MKKLFQIIGFFLTAHLMMGQVIQKTITDGSMYSIHDTGGNLLSYEYIFPRWNRHQDDLIWGFVEVWKMITREGYFQNVYDN